MFFDPPHLCNNTCLHGLKHGFQLESGLRITLATIRLFAHVFKCRISDRAYNPMDKQNVPLGVAFLQLFNSIGNAACSLDGRSLSAALRGAIPAVRLTGLIFDLLLLGYFDAKLTLYVGMKNLSTGHQLLLYIYSTNTQRSSHPPACICGAT